MKSSIATLLTIFASTTAHSGQCYVKVNFWNKSTTAPLPISNRAQCFAMLDSKANLHDAAYDALKVFFLERCNAEEPPTRYEDRIEGCVNKYLKAVFSKDDKQTFTASINYSVASKPVNLSRDP